MDDLFKIMIKIYKTTEEDWMKFKITKENPLTYHHIIKEEYGGEKTLDNGALLTRSAHRYLHQMEEIDPVAYEKVTKLLKKINNRKGKPSEKLIREIEEALSRYEQINNAALRAKYKSKTKIKKYHDPKYMRMVLQKGQDPFSHHSKKR